MAACFFRAYLSDFSSGFKAFLFQLEDKDEIEEKVTRINPLNHLVNNKKNTALDCW